MKKNGCTRARRCGRWYTSEAYYSRLHANTTVDAQACSTVADTQAPAASADTQAPAAPTGTQEPATSADTQTPAASVDTQAPAASVDNQTPAASADTQEPATSADTQTPTAAADTQAPTAPTGTQESASTDTQTPVASADNQTPTAPTGTQEPATAADTQAPAASADTQEPTVASADTQTPAASADTQTPAAAADTQAPTAPTGMQESAAVDTQTPTAPTGTQESAAVDTQTPATPGDTQAPAAATGTKEPQGPTIDEKIDAAMPKLNHRGRRLLKRLRANPKWHRILKFLSDLDLVDLARMTKAQRGVVLSCQAALKRLRCAVHHSGIRLEQRRSFIAKRALLVFRRKFGDVPDARASNVHYKIPDLMAACVAAVACGADDIEGCETYMKNNPDTIRYYLGLTAVEFPDIPSDTTLRRILDSVDPTFADTVCFEWCQLFATSPIKHIAIDGKAVRAVTEIIDGKEHTVYILNVYDATNGIFLHQMRVGAKTNEDASFPTVVDAISAVLQGVTVTGDAAFTHSDNMRAILGCSGHYIFPIKANLRKTMPEIMKRFHALVEAADNPDDPDPPVDPELPELPDGQVYEDYEERDNDEYHHGRFEYRQVTSIRGDLAAWCTEGTLFSGLVRSIAAVFRYRKVITHDADGNVVVRKETENVFYYVSDREDLSAEDFAHYVRRHWYATEINHYLLDVVLDEDHSRIRTGRGLEMFSRIRKTAVTLLRWLQKTVAKHVSTPKLRAMLGQAQGVRADALPTKDEEQKRLGEEILKKTQDNLNRALEKMGSAPIDIYSIPEFDFVPVDIDPDARPLTLSEIVAECQAAA